MDIILISSSSADFPSQWADYICSETMSRLGDIDSPDATVEVPTDDGKTLTINIKKM